MEILRSDQIKVEDTLVVKSPADIRKMMEKVQSIADEEMKKAELKAETSV